MNGPIRLGLAALCLAIGLPVLAADGVTDTSVRFAQVAALDGPAAALGTGMRDGILAAFEEANRAGGVRGRKVELDSFDDGYEPARSITQVREVIDGKNHIGLIGTVGTPTTQATQPLATAAGMALIGPFTGAGFLRKPEMTNVVNIRASYDAEAEAWVSYLVDQQGFSNIAVLYQDDGFGRAGLEGARSALMQRGLIPSAEAKYVRNTTAVKTALLEIRRMRPDAVLMVGAYKPMAKFIQVARQINFNPVFVNISFVGSDALASALGPEGTGVIVSQVVPFPWDDSLPIVAQYQAALAASAPDAKPGFVSLEGYLVGRVALMALDKAGPDPDRAKLTAALSDLGSFDLGGLGFQFGPDDNQGLDRVFLTRITPAGRFAVVETATGTGG